MDEQRLDLYILGFISTYGIQYVVDNFIYLRNEYYINKYGG